MNDRIPELPPVIAPVPAGVPRPLWSVMIPTYNCISYLRETLESVLVQDPGVKIMQIQVVDDCSNDGDVELLVNEIGKGRVEFFRQPENRGSLRNFETCINRSRGELVHLLHGDDKVKPGFYSEIEKLFAVSPTIGSAITGFCKMDETGKELYQYGNLAENFGIIENWLYKIAQNQLVQPPAVVVKRSVYEKLGGFFAAHYGEDWEMWVRIAAHYPVAYSPKGLALYRNHTNNVTSRSYATGQNIRDINKMIKIIQNYLPADQRKPLQAMAKRNYSHFFTKTAHKIIKTQRNYRAAITQATGALKMQVSKTTVLSLFKVYLKSLLKKSR